MVRRSSYLWQLCSQHGKKEMNTSIEQQKRVSGNMEKSVVQTIDLAEVRTTEQLLDREEFKGFE